MHTSTVRWRIVAAEMAKAIREYRHNVIPHFDWQQEVLSGIFRPICYLTGKCQFQADFDRYCSIRDRVEEHHRKGESSKVWLDIQPAEWLLDHNSARKPT